MVVYHYHMQAAIYVRLFCGRGRRFGRIAPLWYASDQKSGLEATQFRQIKPRSSEWGGGNAFINSCARRTFAGVSITQALAIDKQSVSGMAFTGGRHRCGVMETWGCVDQSLPVGFLWNVKKKPFGSLYILETMRPVTKLTKADYLCSSLTPIELHPAWSVEVAGDVTFQISGFHIEMPCL